MEGPADAVSVHIEVAGAGIDELFGIGRIKSEFFVVGIVQGVVGHEAPCSGEVPFEVELKSLVGVIGPAVVALVEGPLPDGVEIRKEIVDKLTVLRI